MGISKLIVDIDADLKNKFKAHVAAKGKTMKDVVEAFVKQELKEGEKNG